MFVERRRFFIANRFIPMLTFVFHSNNGHFFVRGRIFFQERKDNSDLIIQTRWHESSRFFVVYRFAKSEGTKKRRQRAAERAAKSADGSRFHGAPGTSTLINCGERTHAFTHNNKLAKKNHKNRFFRLPFARKPAAREVKEKKKPERADIDKRKNL